MKQSTIQKVKGSNQNKDQSPLKNLDIDMKYQSSVQLSYKFKIMRQQLSNERNDIAKKQKKPIRHNRKNFDEVRTSHMTAGKW